MSHDLAIFFAEPTIGAQLFTTFLAAVPVLIGSTIHYFTRRAERREKEALRRMVKREVREYLTHEDDD